MSAPRCSACTTVHFQVPESGLTVIGGDFNSLAPGDPEPDELDTLPAHFRARYVDLDGKMDRRPIASLLQAGLVDIAAQSGETLQPTVPGAGSKAVPQAEACPPTG